MLADAVLRQYVRKRGGARHRAGTRRHVTHRAISVVGFACTWILCDNVGYSSIRLYQELIGPTSQPWVFSIAVRLALAVNDLLVRVAIVQQAKLADTPVAWLAVRFLAVRIASFPSRATGCPVAPSSNIRHQYSATRTVIRAAAKDTRWSDVSQSLARRQSYRGMDALWRPLREAPRVAE